MCRNQDCEEPEHDSICKYCLKCCPFLRTTSELKGIEVGGVYRLTCKPGEHTMMGEEYWGYKVSRTVTVIMITDDVIVLHLWGHCECRPPHDMYHGVFSYDVKIKNTPDSIASMAKVDPRVCPIHGDIRQ